MKKKLALIGLVLILASCSSDETPLTKGEQNAVALRKYLHDNPEINVFFGFEYNAASGNWDPINTSSTATETGPNYKIENNFFSFMTHSESAWENFNLEYLARFDHTGSTLNLYFIYSE